MQAFRWLPHDPEVDCVGLQLFDDLCPVVNRQLELQARMQLDELGQQARREIFCGADHAEPNAAVPHTAQRSSGLLEVVQAREQFRRQPHQFLAGFRDLQAPAHGFKQGKFQLMLELPQLHGYSRLRQMKRLGGRRDAAFAADRGENFELPDCEMPPQIRTSDRTTQ